MAKVLISGLANFLIMRHCTSGKTTLETIILLNSYCCCYTIIAGSTTSKKQLWQSVKKCIWKRLVVLLEAVHKWRHPLRGDRGSVKRWHYSISLFVLKWVIRGRKGSKISKMGDIIYGRTFTMLYIFHIFFFRICLQWLLKIGNQL